MKNKDKKFAYSSEEYTSLLLKFVELTNCETYLELGICKGKNISEISKYCNNCIGVDIVDIVELKNFNFYKTTTDDFFKIYDGSADIIFIDANHDFEQVKIDFANSLKILNKHGIIFLHDTDPVEEYLLNSKYCSDSYKMYEWIKLQYSDLDIVTLPIGTAGLTIVNRKNDKRHLNFIK